MGMPGRLAYRIYHSFWVGLDWLYPPTCGGCGHQGSRWCLDCQKSTRPVSSTTICPLCGQLQARSELCARCRNSAPRYAALRSWAVFDGRVRNALHRLKYRRDIGLGESLAYHLIETYEQQAWQVEVAMPVPLGLARLAERGYNQAALLARPLALAFGMAYSPQALWRSRETRSQVGLSAALRKENVAGAFQADARRVAGKRVMVVDDVTTTGSTLDACAAALLDAGATAVYGLTLARALAATADLLPLDGGPRPGK